MGVIINQHFENQYEDVSRFRKIIFAKHYLKIQGFDLRIDTAMFEETIKELKANQKTQTIKQGEVFDYLNKYLGSDLIIEKYISVICDRVDLYVPSQRLVIEVDGKSHYLDNSYKNEFNSITEAKTFMLEKSGYTVVRLNNKELGRNFESYIKKNLSKYLDLEKQHKIKN